jgi:hypothetical protein
MDDRTEKDPPVRRFAKGDKVLARCISRRLPIAEVLEIYESADGQQVLLVAYDECRERQTFALAEHTDYVGERKFIAAGTHIYRVSNGEVVAESQNWANIIADLLETFTPPFPGDAEAKVEVEDALWRERAFHDAWIDLNR